MSYMQSMLFQYDSAEDVREFLRTFSEIAIVKEGPDLYFYTQLPGHSPFQFDCEFVDSGFVTTREGEYFLFFGRFVDALTSRFGEIVLGPENAFPGGNV
jgi:hypothetical protein